MAKQNKSIDVTCGIYSTEYKLIAHRDGSYSVKCPTVKWVGNTGTLAFETIAVPAKRLNDVLWMFENEVSCNQYGNLTMEDCLSGY